MSGRVLLVDDVSTHRIILKVKLSAAYYDVSQATGIDDAVLALPLVQPDLILISSRLIKNDMQDILDRLKPDSDTSITTIVLLADSEDKSLRINALRFGFDDVISTPIQENYLLARLRSLMRHRHHAQDLQQHSVAARALGFAESQKAFARPALITLVMDDKEDGARFRLEVQPHCAHQVDLSKPDALMSTDKAAKPGKRPADVLIADLRQKTREDGARFIADLRASALVKDCPVLPLVATDAGDLAANLLDMGVSEVLFDDASPEELSLRLTAQLHQKRAGDEMRDQIKNSLEAAVTDPLTGLYNRRYALSYLKCLLSAVGQEERTFAVMVADLDHFKRINDSYGHAAGDTVLARVAAILNDWVQGRDMVARIGGEEFLIILPDTTRFKAHGVAQNLCKAIRSMSLTLPGQADPVDVTVSIGLTLTSAAQIQGQTIDARASAVLEQADRALYTSKAEGRNTVTLANLSAA